MATTDRDRVSAKAERLVGDAGPSEVERDAVDHRARWDRSFWLCCILVGAGFVGVVGAYVLLQGDDMGSFPVMLIGTCLLLGGLLVWLGTLAVLTWCLTKDTWLLIRPRTKGVRNNSPHIEQQ